MFERDHPEPLALPEGVRRRRWPTVRCPTPTSPPEPCAPRPSPPTAGPRRCSTAPTRSPGVGDGCSSPSPRCRSRRWTCSAPRAPPTSARRALPYVPGVQAVGVVRDGPARARRPPGLVPHHGRAWRRATAGMAELAVAVPPRPSSSRPTCPTPPWRRSACRRSRRGRCSRPGAALRPGRDRCSCSGAGGVVGQVAVQAARLLGAGRVVAAARSARRAGPGRRLRRGCRGRPAHADDDVAALADRLREACEGGVDVVVDPLAGVPGAGGGARCSRDGGRLVNLGSSAGAAVSVDSAALRSRSAAVLGYTNNALTDERRRVGLRDRPHPRGGRTARRDAHDVVPCTRRRPPGRRRRGPGRTHRVVVTP